MSDNAVWKISFEYQVKDGGTWTQWTEMTQWIGSIEPADNRDHYRKMSKKVFYTIKQDLDRNGVNSEYANLFKPDD